MTCTHQPWGQPHALDLTGMLGNALLAGVIARSANFDAVGFAALAVVSGLGGGAIRDVLLQQGTPAPLGDYTFLLTALAGAALALVFNVDGRVWNWAWPTVDALALGCWAVTGTQKTLAVGLGWLPALVLGVVSAVGGGAVRDIMMRRSLAIFGGNTLYATCALAAGAWSWPSITCIAQRRDSWWQHRPEQCFACSLGGAAGPCRPPACDGLSLDPRVSRTSK